MRSSPPRSPARSPELAQRLALAWARAYTRGLADTTASRRREELASDCYEQRAWGREVGASPVAVAISMVARTAAGMPADLLWRRATLADCRDQPLRSKEAMMERFKRSWWVVLGAVSSAMVMVTGVLLPFEDGTSGALVGGVVIALLGATGLAGVWVRRRHRVRGDLMMAAGVTPMLPFIWAVIPPIGAIVVITAAAVDAAHAQSADDSSTEVDPVRDPVVSAGVAVLVAVVIVAVVVGDPGLAIAMVTPVVAYLLAHLALRRRLVDRPLIRVGLTLMLAGVATTLLSYATLVYEDTYFVGDDPAGRAILSLSSFGFTAGVVLVVVGLRRGRDTARPA